MRHAFHADEREAYFLFLPLSVVAMSMYLIELAMFSGMNLEYSSKCLIPFSRKLSDLNTRDMRLYQSS